MRLWWTGLQQFLTQRYPDVFADGEAGDQPCDPSRQWQDFMLMLTDCVEKEKEVEATPMHSVLARLQHKIEQARRLEEQMKRHG